ncbi:DUF3275 family protein [Alcaligenes faecalis]|uniref:DUF3275 family protein n=1 Tax=Alcaligenes faecalis TaxID=511 RepID=UPI000E1AB018|nr:DUF3275 family protein [Alcaligenes faecalis]SSY68822.1 Protein of uncharacterised function (DUF3275) [Alcaligenes faecalis subsp. faecalis]
MIRIDGAQLRVKRIRQSRNGAFCVADLSTAFGEFKVKDPLLDQFEEGEYQATVWISEIYLSQYIAFGKGVTEIRARLHDLQVESQAELSTAHEQAEPDPIDEQRPVRVAPPKKPVPPPSTAKDFSHFNKGGKPQSGSSGSGPQESTEGGHDGLLDAEMLRAIANRDPIKLDATVERALLRRQAAELGQRHGYRFDAKQQIWFAQ